MFLAVAALVAIGAAESAASAEQLADLPGRGRPALAGQRDEGAHDLGVEALAGVLLDRLEAGVGRPRVLVWTFRGERVEDVGDRDDSRRERDLLALLAVGIAPPIPALVMLARDRPRRLEEPRLAEHLLAIDAVLLDDAELLIREVMLALKDVVRRVDLADVVHDTRVPELLDEIGGWNKTRGGTLTANTVPLLVVPGGAGLGRRPAGAGADSLRGRPAELLVRDALLLERALELLPA